MPVLNFALGVFGFVAFLLLIFWYTQYLSNSKKHDA